MLHLQAHSLVVDWTGPIQNEQENGEYNVEFKLDCVALARLNRVEVTIIFNEIIQHNQKKGYISYTKKLKII